MDNVYELKIYKLMLHESASITSCGEGAETYWQVLRVAGGWIYTQWDSEKQDYKGEGIFVPFSNEFQEE